MNKPPQKRQSNQPARPANAPSEQSSERLLMAHQVAEFSGPLPDPETLRQYNVIVPGSAERIIAMAEMYASHGVEMGKNALKAQVSFATRGQWFAILSTVMMAAVSVVALLTGHPAVAGIILFVPRPLLAWPAFLLSGESPASQTKNHHPNRIPNALTRPPKLILQTPAPLRFQTRRRWFGFGNAKFYGVENALPYATRYQRGLIQWLFIKRDRIFC